MPPKTRKAYLPSALALTLAIAPGLAQAVTEVESPEIVISATKTEKSLREVPATVAMINGDESAQYGNNSIADMVKDIPGVEVTDVSTAGSKRLMIRGESGDRIIVLVDGQKINEQISMGGAPLLVDPATVERIEVVKGAASVLYGSEAIGGVVNIITKKGGEKPIGGTVAGSYNSGTDGYEGSLSLYGSTGGLYYRLTGSYSDQDNRETPDGTLPESDSLTKNVSGRLGYKGNNFDTGLILEKYKVEADVPPTGSPGTPFFMNLNLPEWSRDKVGIHADFTDISQFFAKVHVDGYYQKTFKDFHQHLERIDVPMGGGPGGGMPGGGPGGGMPGGGPGGGMPGGGPGGGMPGGGPGGGMPPIGIMDMQTGNDQATYAFNAQIDMTPGSSHYLIGGLAFSYDTLDAKRDIVSTLRLIPSGNYFDEASIKTWAVYLQDEWMATDNLTFTFGVRQTWVESEMEKTNNPMLQERTLSDGQPVVSAGVAWTATDDLALRALYSQGYRFPDLVKLLIGTFHGMGTPTLPNPNLDPETSNNFELGARFDNGRLEADLALFYNLADNYITSQPFNGLSRYENVDEAKTYGLEAWLGYHFDLYNLTPYLNATIMRRHYDDARNTDWDTGTPLVSGKIGLRFEYPLASKPMTFWGDFYLRGASDAKSIDRRGQIEKHDSWATANLALGLKWGENDNWQASLNFNNIFDKKYSTAQNDLDATGVHVVARLSYTF